MPHIRCCRALYERNMENMEFSLSSIHFPSWMLSPPLGNVKLNIWVFFSISFTAAFVSVLAQATQCGVEDEIYFVFPLLLISSHTPLTRLVRFIKFAVVFIRHVSRVCKATPHHYSEARMIKRANAMETTFTALLLLLIDITRDTSRKTCWNGK